MRSQDRTYVWAVILSAMLAITPPHHLFAQSGYRAITLISDRPASSEAQPVAPNRQSRSADAQNYRSFGRLKVGQTADPQTLTFAFQEPTKLASIVATADFHVSGGSCAEGHSYLPGEHCTIEVAFTPQGPGHRTGKVTLADSEAKPLIVVPTGGDSDGPALSFVPAQIVTLSGTYPSDEGLFLKPQAIDIDGGDNLYIADTGNNLVRYRDSSGTITTIAGGGTNPATTQNVLATTLKLNQPYALTHDQQGDLYISDSGDNLVIGVDVIGIEISEVGGGPQTGPCTFAEPCSPTGVAIDAPYGIALDSQHNIYVSTGTSTNTGYGSQLLESIVSGSGTGLVTLNPGYAYFTTNYPLTNDSDNNLYYTFELPADLISGIPANCYIAAENHAEADLVPGATATGTEAEWIVAGTRNCGFSGDGGPATGAEISNSVQGFAWDAAGNFYFTDTGNQRVRRIDGKTGIIRTIAGNGIAGYTGDGNAATGAELRSPTGLAVNSAGTVFTTAMVNTTGNAVLRQIGGPGEMAWGPTALGTSTQPQTILISNTGNDTLDFAHIALTSGDTGDFTIDPGLTTCLTTQPLASGDNCYISVIFTPAALGARTAILTIADNTPWGSHFIDIYGDGASPAKAVLSPTSLTFASQATGTKSASQAVKLTNTGGVSLAIDSLSFTGTNATDFAQTNNCPSFLAAGAFCTISVTFDPGATGAASGTLNVVTGSGTVTNALTGTGIV